MRRHEALHDPHGVAQVEGECCRGAPIEDPWGDRFSRELRHEREENTPQILLGRSGAQEGAKHVLRAATVDDGAMVASGGASLGYVQPQVPQSLDDGVGADSGGGVGWERRAAPIHPPC